MAVIHPTRVAVVHVAPQLRLGAGRYIVETVLEQRRQGHEVWLAVGVGSDGPWRSDAALIDELQTAGVTVVKTGDLFHRTAATLRESSRLLRAALPGYLLAGVAHAHTAMTAAVARWAGIQTVVATCHGWNIERDPAFDLQDALAFQLVDAITSPSAYWARIVEREMGTPEVTVIPVGLDLRRFPAPEPVERAGPLRIVSVAELTARKGLADLLEAMPLVWCQSPDVRLHLMGDGDARQALEAQAAAVDPGGQRIVFQGFVAGPYAHIPAFDVFCLPSRSDNFPVALMEAMLAGLPVVATDVGGIPELVARSGCGRVVPAEQPDALAAAISGVLALTAKERSRLGSLGAGFVRDHCSIETTVRQLIGAYAEARARRQGGRPHEQTPCA